MGDHLQTEAVTVCRNEDASLPLPKNDEENQDLGQLGGGLIDAFDFDQDGVWVDSNGHELEYFRSHVYYGDDGYAWQQPGSFSYQYIFGGYSEEHLWIKVPDLQRIVQVRCFKLLNPPCVPPSVNELFEYLGAILKNVHNEVSSWKPGKYERRGERAQTWLSSILYPFWRSFDYEINDIPESVLGSNCFIGISDTVSLCNRFAVLLDWMNLNCSRRCKLVNRKKPALERRCRKILSWKP